VFLWDFQLEVANVLPVGGGRDSFVRSDAGGKAARNLKEIQRGRFRRIFVQFWVRPVNFWYFLGIIYELELPFWV
jgi:hypothetical protein